MAGQGSGVAAQRGDQLLILARWITVAVVLSCRPAFSADKQKRYMILGAGAVSCGKWTADRSAKQAFAEIHWLTGFLSAYNQYEWPGTDVTDNVDIEGLLGWVDNYCRENPLTKLSTAAASLAGYLATHNSEFAPVSPKSTQ